MAEATKQIPKSFSEEPIVLPKNPFFDVLKRFGTDEFISMFINVIGTFIISFFTSSLVFLSIAGPIIEKLGFFPAHFKEATSVYRTTPKDRRKSIFYYYKRAIKNGSTSLIEDLVIHDPIYILLMFLSLSIAKGTPVWVLAALSFIIAVVVVAFLEVLIIEVAYIRFKNSIKNKGFGHERYYESRFLISKNANPKKILDKVRKDFNLPRSRTLDYDDKYFENTFPKFSGRTPRVRLRNRTGDNKKNMKTLQLIYTKAYESTNKKIDQFRFFPILKEKLYYVLEDQFPKNPTEINNKKIKNTFKSVSKVPEKKVKFTRTVLRSDDILFSIDTLDKNKNYFVLEIKSHKNKKLLIEAMRYVMREFPVIQTTKGKFDFL